MKNIFPSLASAKILLKTGGGNSRQFKHFWQYAACLLLAFFVGIGNVWGETVLKTIDFSSSEWSNIEFKQGNTETNDVFYGVTFRSKHSSYKFSISDGKLEWPNNNMASNNYFLAFPVENIVDGTLIIKVYNGTDVTAFKYDVKDGATSFSSSSISATECGSKKTQGPAIAVKTGLSNANKKAYVYLGRFNGDTESKKVSRIVVSTPGRTDLAASAFYPLYASTNISAGTIVSGASFPSYMYLTSSEAMSTNNGKLAELPDITSPYDFDALGTSNTYYRIKTGSSKSWTIQLYAVSHVKSVRFYGNANGGTGRKIVTTITKVAGEGGDLSVDDITLENAATKISEYSTGDLTSQTNYDANTYYTYSFTIGNTSDIWGIYVEYAAPTGKTLQYNANGGSGTTMENTTGTGTVTLRANTYTKSGCTFQGWATSQANANAGTVAYEDEDDGYNLSADATLYAVWKLNAPEISCINNVITMTEPAGATVYYTTDGSTTPTSGSPAYNSSSKPVIAANTTFKAIAIKENHVSSNVTTYNAIYAAPKYTISFEGNENTSGEMSAIANIASGSDQALTANSFAKTGYNFSHWTASVNVTVGEATITAGSAISDGATLKNITSDITLTAQWSAVNYDITYTTPSNGSYTIKVGDASAVSANTTAQYNQTITLAAEAADGYKFKGWTVMNGVTPVEVANNQFTMPAANVTVTAAFEEIVCIGNEGGTVFSADAITSSNVKKGNGTTEITSSEATVTGGTLYAVSGQSDEVQFLTSAGRFYMNNNDTRFKLELDCALRAGDTIKIDGQGGTKNSDPKGLWVSTATSRPSSAPAAVGTNSSDSWHTPMLSYVVTSSDEYVGKKTIFIYRAVGAGTTFDNVRIIRPAKYAMTFDAGDGEGSMASVTCIEKSQVTLPACTFTAPENKEFDAWVVTKTIGGASVTVTDGKFTMPQEAVKATATWKAITPKYGVTYVLNGPTGDAPTEAAKEAGAEFALAAAPSWSGHVFQGWKWTDNSSVDHVEEAEADFTMPAYAVTFTAQWKLDPNASMANAKYVIGGSALNMAAKFSSLNTSGAVLFSLKESYAGASITEAGSFSATVAGEYIVVANQAGNASYEEAEVEATVEVLESELEETYVWKKSAYTGSCVASPNADAPAAQYTNVTVDGMASVASGRPETAGDVTITLAINNAYSSLFGIKSVCAFGKIEETAGIEYSWNNTNWTSMAGGESGDSQHEFTAPDGSFPTSLYIRFTNVETGKKGVWFRNALVTLEAKKAIVSTVIDLTDVKINGTSISSANLSTLKTGPAYALNLADEYVTAPTVKFNKHTVITYDDDSEVEKDDIITETADVNLSGKWEASAEIDEITYIVTMAKADAFVVHYYQADGETLIGSENVAVSGHPTAAGITPTPQDYKRVVWKLSGEPVDLEDVTSDVAGTEINLVASYVTAYASSINIEQWVLDNRKNNTAFRAVLDAQGFKYSNLDDLDSLTVAKNETDRNYPFLGQKWKLATSEISFLLREGSTVKARFGNMGSSVNVKIGTADAVELTSGTYANASLSSTKEYSYTATEDVVVKFQGTGTGTVVFKQIMIDEAIETIKLPAVVTYDANGGSFAKTSEKYTGTPLVIGDATPASDDYLFDGWHLGTVDGAAIDATGYEPTKNVTLVAKYVLKPSPFSLSALTYKIGDGATTAVGYEEGTYEYTVKLPYAHSYDAITVAATIVEATSDFKAAISQPATVPGDASFTVVADDESEQEYVIHFVKDAKDGLEIIGAVVTGNTTATVTGVYKGDASVKLNSKKIDNGDYYIYVTLKDGYTFEETDVLVVDVHTKSDIGTKALEITTGVDDISGDVWKTIALDDYSTGENIIALTGIAANQTSIGLKRSANINAKINGLKVLRPMNPVLKTVTVAGVEGEPVADVVTIEVPFSTLDAALSSVAIDWVSNSDAWTAAHDPAVADAWAWGVENTVTFTDKDGDESVYYVTVNKAAASSDATLSALSYGDPATAIALQDGVYEYNVILPYGTAVVPALAATKNHVGAAEPVIADASVFANRHAASTVTVTAEDNSTVQVYTVNFEVSRYQEIMLWDGSTMSNVMTNGSASLKGVTWEATGVSPTSFSAKTCAENSKSYTSALDFGGVTGTSRQFSITIPNGYLAKLSLVYRAKDTDERYLMISSALAGTVNENTIGSVKAQGNSSDLFVVSFDQLVTGKVYINTTQGFHVHEIRIMMTPGHGRSITPGTYGTVCVDHNVAFEDIQGVTVYELMGREPVYRKLAFDEIVSGELEAGAPYVFQATGDRMIMLYGETKVDDPVDKGNGMYGTFEQVVLTELNDVYYFAQRALWSCDGALDLTIPANRAYVKLSEIGDVADPNPAPGRRRVTMDVNGEKIATGIDEITNDQSPMTNKVIIDGRLLILRGEKMYDATGRLVK